MFIKNNAKIPFKLNKSQGISLFKGHLFYGSLNKQQDDLIMVAAGPRLTCEEGVGGLEADAGASVGVEAH